MTIQKGNRIDHVAIGTDLATPMEATYQLRLSDQLEDPAWDAFLEETPGGHHVQTSLWAQVKTSLNWRPIRLVVTCEEQIVAGVQILVRSLPILGDIGFISKGPLQVSENPFLSELVVKELQEIAKTRHIRLLTVQPPGNGESLARRLPDWGFQPTSTKVAPSATVLIDLSKELDTILAEMDSKTRYNIRLSQRKGIEVRAGQESDLVTYHQILTATGQRQGFVPYPEQYFTDMWRILNPHGYIKLFLAEFKGEVVSAQLAIPFGDTVINKLSVWSGRYGKHRPNEALQWACIEWAKSARYRYYDFEGIEPAAARAILRQEPLPASLKQTVTSFKLGFGGQVTLFPGAFDYIHNPFLRWAYVELFPKVKQRRVVKRLVKRIRTH